VNREDYCTQTNRYFHTRRVVNNNASSIMINDHDVNRCAVAATRALSVPTALSIQLNQAERERVGEPTTTTGIDFRLRN